jgi:hypothetical protein
MQVGQTIRVPSLNQVTLKKKRKKALQSRLSYHLSIRKKTNPKRIAKNNAPVSSGEDHGLSFGKHTPKP